MVHIIKKTYITVFRPVFEGITGIHLMCILTGLIKKPCCLPDRKAEDTTSLALSRVCGKELQLHPRRLKSAASSTFATLGFIQPDYRYFINNGRTREETIDFVLRVLKEFGNNPEGILDFFNRVHKSNDVVFALIYGSAVNSNAAPSEIEDVDILIATQNRKFVYDWDQPKGTEIRYLFVTEIENYLTVKKRFFVPVFSKGYNTLGGIFANGLLAIKSSKELEKIIHGVRRNFQKIYVRALSQIVENDCKKRAEKMPPPSHGKRQYSFYGSESLISLDEARLMIDESITRRNIQPGIAPAIARIILKRIITRSI
jgi:hypothetical protein